MALALRTRLVLQASPEYPFPPGLVDVIEELWPRIDRAVTKRLNECGIELWDESALEGVDPVPDEDMSGAYGTIFFTSAPGWVVKVTCDPNEGPAAEAIRRDELLSGHPGVVDILGVWVAPDHTVEGQGEDEGEDLPVFVILREAVTPLDVSPSIVEDLEAGRGPLNYQAIWNARRMSADFNAEEDPATKLALGNALEIMLEELEDIQDARLVADFMGLFKETFGVALADVHPGNVGMREGEREWVIFDVGHSRGFAGRPVPFLPNPLVIDVI